MRMSTFRVDTTLYHPISGAQVFAAGDQDPGAAWSNTATEAKAARSLTFTDDAGSAQPALPPSDDTPAVIEADEPADKVAIRKELAQLGADIPHHATGLTKLREALGAARAAARAPE